MHALPEPGSDLPALRSLCGPSCAELLPLQGPQVHVQVGAPWLLLGNPSPACALCASVSTCAGFRLHRRGVTPPPRCLASFPRPRPPVSTSPCDHYVESPLLVTPEQPPPPRGSLFLQRPAGVARLDVQVAPRKHLRQRRQDAVEDAPQSQALKVVFLKQQPTFSQNSQTGKHTRQPGSHCLGWGGGQDGALGL